MNIKQVILKNIGPFTNEKIEFGSKNSEPNIHILVGPNGTGKTTILHSLSYVFDFFEPDHKEHLSNKLHKRFVKDDSGKFEDNKLGVAESYSHVILETNQEKQEFEKIISYGCKNCGNIHQNYEKTVSKNFVVASNGKEFQNQPRSKELLAYKQATISKDIKGKKFSFAAFGYSGYRFVESENIVDFTEKENINPLYLALEFEKRATIGQSSLSSWIISTYAKAAFEEIEGNKATADSLKYALKKLENSISELTEGQFTFSVERKPWNVRVLLADSKTPVDFDVLPDGLRSILGWLGDLMMRLDGIPWQNESIPVTDQKIFLFLDEIEVHLHPTWQYKVLKIISDLFPNAQIFVSTHSPFILNSIDKAKIYVLEKIEGKSVLSQTLNSETGWSIQYILKNILKVDNTFGFETMQNLKKFNQLDKEIVKKDFTNEVEFIEVIDSLKSDGVEVISMIAPKLMRLKEIIGKDYLYAEDN